MASNLLSKKVRRAAKREADQALISIQLERETERQEDEDILNDLEQDMQDYHHMQDMQDDPLMDEREMYLREMEMEAELESREFYFEMMVRESFY